jgi:hypothetical protein
VIELFRTAARGKGDLADEMLRAFDHARRAFGDDEGFRRVLADFNVTLAAGGAGGVA